MKIEGYEVKIFIEESNYELLKNKAKNMNLTVDEYIEKLIKKVCELKWMKILKQEIFLLQTKK